MRTLIGIPVYNEEKHITEVLQEVCKYPHDVLVVDDGSNDSTPTLLAEHNVEVIRHTENHGVGRTLQEMFRWASQLTYDWLITLDSDGQHDPAEIADFIERINCDDADIISGSRYLEIHPENDKPPKEREAINRQVTLEMNNALGIQITDTFTGYKAYRVSRLSSFDIDVDGYAFPIQFWVQAAVARMRICELPIRLIYNDLHRKFGGELDDPIKRLDYYRAVLCRELRKYETQLPNAMEHVPC
jgi:glycosyltransferase involved in cell wall biosynthesis